MKRKPAKDVTRGLQLRTEFNPIGTRAQKAEMQQQS
jgi:hypothetical protein